MSTHEDHAGREAGLEFYDLSHPWGHDAPLWPYFPDVKIERFHYHAKSGVLSQQITTFMHCTTHTDAPAHVIEGTRFIDEVPLSSYFGAGVVVSIPKEKWEVITAQDLEDARPEIRPGAFVIVNTGWHRHYRDFPLWEPCHRHLLGNGIVGFENVGGQIDEVTGKRCTFAAFPWRWTKGDGCIVRLVAMIDPTGDYRMESGS